MAAHRSKPKPETQGKVSRLRFVLWSKRALHLLFAFVLWGCGGRDASSLPEWQPSDHLHPAFVEARENEGDSFVESRSGIELFQAHCAGCHGARGEGGPFAPPLDWDALARAPKEELLRLLLQGKGAMPGLAGKVSEKGLEAIVLFLQTRRR
ncbi:MAG: cytochrome c [Sandaracinaceae bacterium]|nr:cytochrome c [Sandaracinaceae bacterium]